MSERLRLAVGHEEAGSRLDAVVSRMTGVSRVRAAGLISSGAVTVDGRPAPKAHRLVPGEVVEAGVPSAEPAVAGGPEPRVILEDDDLLVVDKPAGVVVHPAAGVRTGTLVQGIAATGRALAPRAGEDRPGVVHRLDRDVSGLLLVAKTDRAHAALVDDIAARKVRREYLAAVVGAPEVDTGKIEAPVGRDPRRRTRMAVLPDGKQSVTWFRVRERFPSGQASLLEVRLETGRTHQIRTHLASIGHAVLGDAAYGRDPGLARRAGLVRPFLHAHRLTLTHPLTGERLSLRSDLPPDLRQALEALRA